MYRLLATIILFFCTLNTAAFTLSSNKDLVARRSIRRSMRISSSAQRTTSASPLMTTSARSTALNLRVKVDPNEKEERLNPAVFKNALYLGSVAFAVLLPVVLLVADSK